jgi:hypothetical protein
MLAADVGEPLPGAEAARPAALIPDWARKRAEAAPRDAAPLRDSLGAGPAPGPALAADAGYGAVINGRSAGYSPLANGQTSAAAAAAVGAGQARAVAHVPPRHAPPQPAAAAAGSGSPPDGLQYHPPPSVGDSVSPPFAGDSAGPWRTLDRAGNRILRPGELVPSPKASPDQPPAPAQHSPHPPNGDGPARLRWGDAAAADSAATEAAARRGGRRRRDLGPRDTVRHSRRRVL